ncbi:MAG TPA: hypothetical protein PKJ14_00940 [Candidatus Cloacimonadota bacterium]|nr:hypothetical protein [Candidatus Cloacimonadota bacterium]HQL14150.1 hypothetical protein [Candidatus Cloacimonadota bacterium]
MRRFRIIFLLVFLLFCAYLNGFDDKFVRLVYHSSNSVAQQIKVLDQYVYVYNDWYIYIYNLKNIWNPVVETAFSSTYPITDIAMLDYNKLYVCSHEPTNYITEMDSLNTYGHIFTALSLICNKARKEGNLLYTTHTENGLEIFDLSRSVYPQKISSFSENWGILDMEARYPQVHVLNDFGYVNIDVTDVTQPRTLGYNYEIVGGTVLSVNRNIVWVGAGSNLLAIEITYPEKPVIINRYRFSSDIIDLEARGNELFVALKTSGLRIMDITNPKKINEKNNYYIRTGVSSVALDGDYIYLGAGTQGWFVLEYR